MQTVEDFKKHVKEEKSVGADISHTSSKLHQKIREDVATLETIVKALSAALARNKAQMDRLKVDAAQELLNVEIAQRTRDTPPALQYENTAPYEYFNRLVASFEAQMGHYRRQIEETERSLQALAQGGGGAGGGRSGLSGEDVMQAMAKLQATFTNLAGRYHKVHEAVRQQKELFLQLNRNKYGSEVFDRNDGKSLSASSSSGKRSNPLIHPLPSRIPVNYVGPSPFEGQPDLLSMAKASLSANKPASIAGQQPQQQQQQQPQQQPGAPPPFGFNSTLGGSFGPR